MQHNADVGFFARPSTLKGDKRIMKESHNSTGDGGGLKSYIFKHMLKGIVLAVVVIIVFKIFFGFFKASEHMQTDTSGVTGNDRAGVSVAQLKTLGEVSGDTALPADNETSLPAGLDTSSPAGHETSSPAGLDTSSPAGLETSSPAGHETSTTEGSGAMLSRNTEPAIQEKPAHGSDTSQPHGEAKKMDVHATAATPQPVTEHQTTGAAVQATEQNTSPEKALENDDATIHVTETHGADVPMVPSFPMVGMAFVDAVIRPLDYELNQRFYGWRPNDILDVTDNVNNFQLGVLEVTRRTAIILSERISRTGSTAAFDENLQNAMNWFMIKADRYWFPSAESKYKASLKELRTYFHRLEKGEAQFYSRTDNLIPLLMAYQDLLGSCDDNLVKSYEDDGSPVSFFKSDDYFFYTQGVASAMATMLEGITKDFSVMVDRRGGMEELHHAIEACHHAMELDPWIVLNSDGSSLFANHRLNLAAPISHARFYIDVLIKALST
jgi:hypothetical protein